MRPENRMFATTLVGGLWVLSSMDFAYSYLITLSSILGKPLPYVYRHRHPFVSSSLSEFWGVRWNPLIGKLLQDAFYKPIRRLNGSRATAMVICFFGSAYLHAQPQYISTRNTLDVLRMGGFFVTQGILVPLEIFVVKSAGLGTYFQKYLLPRAGGVYTAARYQWLLELLTVISILSTSYIYLEITPSLFSISFYTTTVGFWWVLIMTVTIVTSSLFHYSILLQLNEACKQRNSKRSGGPPKSEVVSRSYSEEEAIDSGFDEPLSTMQLLGILFFKIVGSIWCIAWILYLLPNFTLPTIHAVINMYPRSFIVGAFVKSILSYC